MWTAGTLANFCSAEAPRAMMLGEGRRTNVTRADTGKNLLRAA
jgi:hypothetical protein